LFVIHGNSELLKAKEKLVAQQEIHVFLITDIRIFVSDLFYCESCCFKMGLIE
jgi:hypothetical protein